MGITEAPRTVLSSYTKIYDGGTLAFTAPYPLGITSGDMDLMTASLGGIGTETQANHVEMIMTVDQIGDTASVIVTGACDGGPEEAIASLAIEASATAPTETAPREWVDTMTLTNLHLSGNHIHVADSGNSRVAKFGFDAIGYRYISVYPDVSGSAITNIRIYARYF